MSKGSFLRPLKALAYLGRPAVTLPMEPRPAAPNYRGFHVNDWEACIGCGTCAQICDNEAIDMVDIPELKADPLAGIKPRRPAIDYGRCCWCALCVDICPTGSISLSREYVHVGPDLNTYYILPDEKGIHGLNYPKGWSKSPDADLLDLKRQTMGEMEPQERLQSFAEMVAGFTPEAALMEASRCIQCGMCHDACPSHMHAPEYIRALWSGDAEEAVRQIYRTNPFSEVCGRVCTRRCEDACSLGNRGEPIAIRWLKRFAMDSLNHEQVRRIAAEGRELAPSGRKVAIVGAGPAGLTCAYDLARQGHAVTVFEALPHAGGMMRYGIPEYRLPYDRLDDDVDVIASLGVEIRYKTRVGHDISMERLRDQFDAVMIAIGLHKGRSTRVPGTNNENVIAAIDLLRDVTLGVAVDVPKKAVVIGGGNVAMDAARTLARLQTRAYGAVQVELVALEPADAMLADADEVREDKEEGVVIVNSRGPRCCIINGERLTGLETVRCLSIFDNQGRFHPLYDHEDAQVHEGDVVVEAIGQMSDFSLFGDKLTEKLDWNGPRPRIDQDGRTSEPWLWAAGDMVEGPDVIHAVAAGHRAAASIHNEIMVREKTP